MSFFRLSLVVLICCNLGIINAEGIPTDQQIKAWGKTLSVKKDPRAARLDAVLKEIQETDTATWCETLDRLNSSAGQSNERAQIRVRILRQLIPDLNRNCKGNPNPGENLREALQAAYEIEDEALQYEIHLRIGQLYNSMFQYGQASMHFRLLLDILNRNNREDFYLPSGLFYDLSFSLYHTHEYEECIRSGLNALHALPDAPIQPDNTLNDYQQMLAWNTIGLAYNKIQKPDSAFLAFDNAARFAEKMSNELWKGIINGNKGDVYFNLDQYDTAYVLLQNDYDHSVHEKQFDNAANSLQWIARIDLKNGQAQKALQKLYTAREHLIQKPQPTYLSNVYYAFSQVYAALGRADSVNTYLQRYLHLHDSLQTEITNSRTDIIEMRMNNLDQIQTIKILNRQKEQIATTRNFTIAIVVLLGCLGYMWMNRARLKMQMRQRDALEGKRIAEADAQKAKQQLEIFRQHLLEKNTLIEKWQSAQETKENSEEQIKLLSDLSHHLILNEDDWIQFKVLFDSVYPGFFLSLRNKVPDITQAEQRMAALSKLKLNAKEAANLLGVSTNTVYTTKRRLRQRLGLENDADLDPYLNRG